MKRRKTKFNTNPIDTNDTDIDEVALKGWEMLDDILKKKNLSPADKKAVDAIKLMVRDEVRGFSEAKDFMADPVARIPISNNKQAVHIMKTSRPTDEISLSGNMLERLASFWYKDNEDHGSYIPSDILWANTIPIRDCIIRTPKDRTTLPKGKLGCNYCRIIVFDKASKENPEMKPCVLVLLHYADGLIFYTYFGVAVVNGEPLSKSLIDYSVGILTDDKRLERRFDCGEPDILCHIPNLFTSMLSYMEAWYGLQVALLNPKIEYVFNEHSSKAVYKNPNRNKRNKPKIEYIKRYIISDDVLDEAIKNTRIYTKLCWYVTGHWRNQATKEGHKRIFIEGYWKGLEREKANGEIRDRGITFEDDNDEFLRMVKMRIEKDSK